MPRIPLFLVALALALSVAAQDPTPSRNTPPRVIRKVEAKYSEKARKNKIEGIVSLQVVISTDGHPRDVKVLKSLDSELDENAIAAVKKYLFQPATKDGEPRPVFATVEIPFRLK